MLDRLLTAYGGLKFGLAEQVLAEEYVRTYQSVDVFGFSISTRRYPFAILALMLVSTWVIAWTVETARQSKRRILSDVHDVDVVDSLLDFQLMRIALWVVLPVISVWAALPLFPLNQTEQIIIVGGVGLVVIMGIVATVRARSL